MGAATAPAQQSEHRRAKVFHVITKLELGGAQKVTLMTLERLSRARYEVALVSGPEGLLVDWANRIPNLERIWLPSLVREVRPAQDLQALIALWRLFRREKPVVVHTHSSKAGILGRWAAWLAGVPVVFHTAHGFGFHDFQSPMARRFYVWLERVTGKITTKLVVVSHANAEKGERAGIFRRGDWILCRDAISVDEFIRNGDPAARGRRRKEWGIPDGRIVVGMIACFKPQKSPVDFIDLAAEVLKETRQVHFVMAGDGELRPAVEARIRELGVGNHLTLLGWQHEKDMPDIYRNFDIVALTSLWEGLPCVFSEAMAVELPIVATNVDGAREAIIDGENGFLHNPHDVKAMAKSVLNLVNDAALRQTMGRRGRARVMEFDIGASVENLDVAYQACLEAR